VLEEQAPLGLKEIIPSTMGEPLLFQDFEEIIHLCRKHGLKMNLTTNGTFPGKGAEQWARLLAPICSDVKISWNGGCKSTQEKIMRGTDWEKNLANLRTFVAIRDQLHSEGGSRCRVTLQLTFMEANIMELPEIVELAVNEGVDRVKGHHLWAHFKEIEGQSLKRGADSIIRWNDVSRRAHHIARTAMAERGFPLLLENFEELESYDSKEREQDKAGSCPFLGKEAWVLGDRARLAQILGCLLKNALTYTLRGCITLKVNHLASDLVVEVTDTGVGMSVRRQHEILDVLEGDSSSLPEGLPGSGHGLSQVWRVIRAMHGAPSLNSHPGLGTTVSISAPWQAASFTALSAASTPPQPKAGPSVLVVDDDEGCADLLLAFLNVLGINASRVANGREAVQRFERAGASLILMDCWMPEMDGFEATRIIREYERELGLPPVPIIAVTANAFVHERDAALAAGMTSHLAKPFSMMQLAEMIETYAPESGTASSACDASSMPQSSRADGKA
jgi:CheY-like chemotaxis protein